MSRIEVGRYTYPESVGFKGWIQPETWEWIVFIRNDGAVIAYNRDINGACVGNPTILE